MRSRTQTNWSIPVSKLLFFDHRCTACGEKFEKLVRPDEREVRCPKCELPAERILSPVGFNLGKGIDPDFPTAYDKWEKTQKKKRENEKKHYDSTGVDRTFGGDVTP